MVVWVGVGDMVGYYGGDGCAVLRRAGFSPSLIPLAGWEKGRRTRGEGLEKEASKGLPQAQINHNSTHTHTHTHTLLNKYSQIDVHSSPESYV